MKNRSIAAVILLPFVTFGIYAIYWMVKTKGELNERGAEIPTAWLLIVPIANIFWLYKYYEGAEKVTDKKVSGVLMFVLNLFVTSLVPMALCQDAYNNMGGTVATATPALVPPEPQVAFTPVSAEPSVPTEPTPAVASEQPAESTVVTEPTVAAEPTETPSEDQPTPPVA